MSSNFLISLQAKLTATVKDPAMGHMDKAQVPGAKSNFMPLPPRWLADDLSFAHPWIDNFLRFFKIKFKNKPLMKCDPYYVKREILIFINTMYF